MSAVNSILRGCNFNMTQEIRERLPYCQIPKSISQQNSVRQCSFKTMLSQPVSNTKCALYLPQSHDYATVLFKKLCYSTSHFLFIMKIFQFFLCLKAFSSMNHIPKNYFYACTHYDLQPSVCGTAHSLLSFPALPMVKRSNKHQGHHH